MTKVDVVLANGPKQGPHRTEELDGNGLPPTEIRVLDAPTPESGRPNPTNPATVYVYRRDDQHSGVWSYTFDRRRVTPH